METLYRIFKKYEISSNSTQYLMASFHSKPVRLMSDVCLLDFYIFNFFFRTAGPILTKVGTNDPWAKGIQNCTNEGHPPPSPRGDNNERVKIY
jgi:hypothetical protein